MATVSRQWSSSVVDCEHPVKRRIIINRVHQCLDCGEWLYSGRCVRCQLPLDEHSLVGVEVPVCPNETAA